MGKTYSEIVFEGVLILLAVILSFISPKLSFYFRLGYKRGWDKLIITKQEIADYYEVSRKTFCKWVKYFAPKLEFEGFKKARKFNCEMLIEIVLQLGLTECYPTMFKSSLVEKLETYYHTLRDNASAFGFGEAEFKYFDVFPPRISEMIILKMG